MIKNLIAGNWKMNGTYHDAKELVSGIIEDLKQAPAITERNEFLVCPPFVHIPIIAHMLSDIPLVQLGAQDCSAHENGAYTGDVSAAMLADLGCEYVILGHSERREGHEESNALIAKKAQRAHDHDLTTIICVGETDEDREQGMEIRVVENQLEGSLPASVDAQNLVIAYEPVWAIGTGKTATPENADEMHNFIREFLVGRFSGGENIRILYGGSMKPANAKDLLSLENVNGGLIGGASLHARDFVSIGQSIL